MWYILKFRLPNLYTLEKIKKGSLKKKERVKGFFLWLCYHSSKLNLTKVRKSTVNKVVVGLLSFLVV